MSIRKGMGYLLALIAALFVVVGIGVSVFVSDYSRLALISKNTKQGIDYISKNGVRHRLVVFVGLDEGRKVIPVRNGYENGDYETILSMKVWVPSLIGGQSLLVPLVLKRDNGTYIYVNNEILDEEKFNEMYPGIKSTHGTVVVGSLMDLTTIDSPEPYFRIPLGAEFDESVLYRTMTDLIKYTSMGSGSGSRGKIVVPLGIPTLVDESFRLSTLMKLWFI